MLYELYATIWESLIIMQNFFKSQNDFYFWPRKNNEDQTYSLFWNNKKRTNWILQDTGYQEMKDRGFQEMEKK